MDISFKCGNEKFNYRVCAMMISDNKIWAMHDKKAQVGIQNGHVGFIRFHQHNKLS